MQCECTVLYCHQWPARMYNIFPHYFIKGTIFGKIIEHKMCVLIFSTILSETFLIVRRIERDVIQNVYWPSCTVLVIRIRF